MSAEDLEMIARVIRKSIVNFTVREIVIASFILELRKDPNFDKEKFRAECRREHNDTDS